MRDSWMRSGDGFLLMYSITDKQSFTDLKYATAVDARRTFRAQIQKAKDSDKGPIVLVGNKSDLSSDREVSREEAQQLAREWGMPFFETSAKTRVNVDEAFMTLVREVRKYGGGGGGGGGGGKK